MPLDFDEERLNRVCRWVRGKPEPPMKVTVFPTFFCNLHCIACGVGDARKAGAFDYEAELDAASWKKIVRRCVSFGVLEWDITGGGEPLSKPDRTLAIAETVRSCNPEAKVELTTNGSWFNPEAYERLVAAGLDTIQFSIDAPDAATHDFLRRRDGVFENAVRGIREVNALKRKMRRKRPFVMINTVLSAKNCDRLEDFVKFDFETGVDWHVLTPMRIVRETRNRIEESGLRMNARQRAALRRNHAAAKRLGQAKARKDGREYRIELAVVEGQEDILEDADVREYTTKGIERDPENPLFSVHCYEPWYSFCIDPYGNAGSCLTAAGFCSAERNLLRQDFKAIWFGGYFENVRGQLLDHLPLSVCSHCTIGDARLRFRRKVLERLAAAGGPAGRRRRAHAGRRRPPSS